MADWLEKAAKEAESEGVAPEMDGFDIARQRVEGLRAGLERFRQRFVQHVGESIRPLEPAATEGRRRTALPASRAAARRFAEDVSEHWVLQAILPHEWLRACFLDAYEGLARGSYLAASSRIIDREASNRRFVGSAFEWKRHRWRGSRFGSTQTCWAKIR